MLLHPRDNPVKAYTTTNQQDTGNRPKRLITVMLRGIGP